MFGLWTLLMGAGGSSLPLLHVDGPVLKNPRGEIVNLRGCNLGNWFVIEHWMWDQSDGGAADQFELEALLSKRFGPVEADRLMEIHRKSWITERDFAIIRSFRFNCVRLPLNYRQFEDDSQPFKLRKDAWKWVDWAIKQAGNHGLYVILDMHGAQGGQSVYDHTGRAGQNKLWSDPENSKRLAWLWGEIAKRYRNNPVVAAYDVFNEPYGGTFEQIDRVFAESFQELRKHDPDKLVWAMGRYDSFSFYGDPKARGWKNVGFQMHYYPGLFGNGSPSPRTVVRHFDALRRDVAPRVKKLNVPFLVGEMNIVFEASGGAEMMRRTYDLHESWGWSTTMWSYKALSRPGGLSKVANWGMVTNRAPLPKLDFGTASENEIAAFFRSHARMRYEVNAPLQKALAPKRVALAPLGEFPKRTRADAEPIPGWTFADIGGSLAGGQQGSAAKLEMFGGGADIWGTADEFRFGYQEVQGDFSLEVTILGLEDLGSYCKAGLMVRASRDPQSPHVLLSSFPNAELQLAERTQAGADTTSRATAAASFPVRIRLQRTGNELVASHRLGNGEWKVIERRDIAHLGSNVLAGVVALSHESDELAKASYADLRLGNLP